MSVPASCPGGTKLRIEACYTQTVCTPSIRARKTPHFVRNSMAPLQSLTAARPTGGRRCAYLRAYSFAGSLALPANSLTGIRA